jgi:hypothetical protein
MNGKPLIAIDSGKIADFCRRHHIRELSLFGSALTGPFSDQSDVDLLYEFQPGYSVGFEIVRIEEELAGILGGRRIDLVPKKCLNRHLRDRILATAQVIYAEG